MEILNTPKFDLQEIVGKIWAVRRPILLFQLLVAVACVAVILLWPRSYRSEARIFLKLGKETISIDPTATTGQTVGIQQSSREDEIMSAIDVLRGRGLITKVVESLTPEVVLDGIPGGEKGTPNPIVGTVREALGSVVSLLRQIDPMSDFERAVTLVEKNIGIDAERKSEVIVIDYEAESPELARLVVDTIVKTYREEHIRLHQTEGSMSFFDSQQELLQNELDAINQSIREAKNKMGLASIAGEKQNLESRIREVSQNLSDTERGLFEIQAKSIKLQQQLDDAPERVASAEVEKPNMITDLQSQQLYTLQLTELEYLSKFNTGHPKLIAIRRQIEEAEKKLSAQSNKRSETTNDINPIHRELSLEYVKAEATRAGLEKRFETLKTQEKEILAQIRQLNSYEIEITDLEREARLREKKYLAYSESLEQVRVNQALETDKISSVSIAQEATLQEKPISPSKLLVVLFSGMAMFAGTIGISLASIKFDNRLTTPASIRARLGIPVMVSIPNSKSFSQQKLVR